MTIDEEITQIRQWRDGQVYALSRVESEVYQRILITACIDAFVQHQDSVYAIRKQGKRVSDRKAFSSFLQQYVTDEQCLEWLQLVCPTTLYYDYQEDFHSKGINLKLQLHRIYAADDPEAIAESERLLALLPENKQESAREKHQYSALIYQMRNKLVHEMTYVGCNANFFTEDSDPVPHMVVLSRHEHNKLIPYKWTLHIPLKLLMLCLRESSENYLNECQVQQKHPLGDYDPHQKSTFAFYD